MAAQEQAINRYCSAVKKHLICSRKTKNDLISGLKAELFDSLADVHSAAQITAAYGTPEVTAASLQDAVSDTEYSQAKRNQKKKIIGVYLVTLAILIGFVCLYVYGVSQSRVVYYTEEIVYDTPTDYGTPAEP